MQQQQLQPRVVRPGVERFVLAAALFVPLAVMAVALAQLQALSIVPSDVAHAEPPLVTHRPTGISVEAPPTLAPPTVTPLPPTPTAGPAPTVQTVNRTYTVQRGDELKSIAADYGISIWSIINANDIPNPDSLRVGQVLKIPNN
jgi:LysM repeat protein